KVGHLEQAAIELRDLGARYQLLKNDVDTANALHDSLLKQQVDTGVNADLNASNVRVVERAEVPHRPSRPSVPLNCVLGRVAGLGAATGAVFLCDSFDNSVKSSEEVEGFLQIPTLATIPNFTLARRASGRPGASAKPATPAGPGLPSASRA